MYAKFEYLNIYAFFIIKYFKILLLVIFYNAIMDKCIFGQAYCQDILRRIPMKFILYFLSFTIFSTYFRSLIEFPRI
jgi:hypothetical protein